MVLPRNEIWPLLFELKVEKLSNYPGKISFLHLLKVVTDGTYEFPWCWQLSWHPRYLQRSGGSSSVWTGQTKKRRRLKLWGHSTLLTWVSTLTWSDPVITMNRMGLIVLLKNTPGFFSLRRDFLFMFFSPFQIYRFVARRNVCGFAGTMGEKDT